MAGKGAECQPLVHSVQQRGASPVRNAIRSVDACLPESFESRKQRLTTIEDNEALASRGIEIVRGVLRCEGRVIEHVKLEMSMSCFKTRRQPRLGAWGACLIGSLLVACGSSPETPQSRAQVDDILVKTQASSVQLKHSFRTAVPNALLDGVVRVQEKGGQRLLEVNAVCSMPNTPGWPSYDNLFGRPIQRVEEAKGPTGTTRWQVLFHFNGRVETRMGTSPGPWLARLRDNLCRRGDFDDRQTKR